MVDVSIYKNIRDTEGHVGDIIEFLTSEEHKALSKKIAAEKDPVVRADLKKTIACCTVSGVFNTRNAENLIKHSGLISIDIDKKDNLWINDWQLFIEELGNFQEIFFAGISVSGEGAFCIIKISNPEQHKEHFLAIEEDFKRWGIKIDPSAKDVVRARFYSYNEKPYINRDSRVYKRLSKQQSVKRQRTTAPQIRPTKIDEVKYHEVKEWALMAHEEGVDITQEYENWFSLACALAWEFGEEGREIYHLFSGNHPNYRVKQTDYKYNEAIKAVNTHGIPHPTHTKIRELCQKYGVTALVDFK